MGHRERVVGGLEVAVLVDALEHREIGDPDVVVRPLAHRWRAEGDAQRPEHLAGLAVLVGDAQDEVADLGPVDDR